MRTWWMARKARTSSTSRAERRAVFAHARQRALEVAHQVGQHRLACVAVGAQQSAHVGQRIEQEVRLDLRLQHLEPPRSELALQADAVQLGLVQRRRSPTAGPAVFGEHTDQQRQHEHRVDHVGPLARRDRLAAEQPRESVFGKPSHGRRGQDRGGQRDPPRDAALRQKRDASDSVASSAATATNARTRHQANSSQASANGSRKKNQRLSNDASAVAIRMHSPSRIARFSNQAR